MYQSVVRVENLCFGGNLVFIQYKQEISKYGKKDALTALCFYVYTCGILFLSAVLFRSDIPLGAFTQTIISTSLVIVPLFALILLRKQNISSIGIHKKNLWPAIRIGIIFCALILLMNVFIPMFLGDWTLHSFGNIMRMFFLTLFVVFMEDTLFSGYIQTRIYGLINNDIVAVLLGAFMFAFSHVAAIVGLVGVSGFGTVISFSMLFWMLAHVIWNLIFRRYFSLFPITMFHFVWNFGNSGVFATSDHALFGGSIYEKYILLVIVVIWLVFSYHKSCKKSLD